MSSDGKTALVTGGASGIGEGCVRRFAADGMKVAILDVNEERGNAIAAELDDAFFLRCDVADGADV